MEKALRIVELRVRNVKRIRAAHIVPDGSMIQITGANGQGKTTILDSIMFAFAGEGSIPEGALRRGADSGEIEVDVGEFKVKRTFTDGKKSVIKVTRPDGAPIAGPQTFLSGLVGNVAFDPLAFSRMDPKAQAAVLRRVLGLDAAFLELDQKMAAAVEARRDVGSRLRGAESELAQLPTPATRPEQPVDLAALVQQVQEAQAANANNKTDREWLTAARGSLQKWDDKIAELERSLAAARESRGTVAARIDEQVDRIEALVDVDLVPMQTRMRDAQAINARVEVAKRRAALVEKVSGLRNEHDQRDQDVKAIQESKTALVEGSKMPVEDLAFGPDGVTFRGIAFDQCSSAEQLKVSVAVGLAQNPRLRIMLVRDGSLLDTASLAALEEMAEAADAQVWVERVDESGEVGVVIEDGAVVEGGE